MYCYKVTKLGLTFGNISLIERVLGAKVRATSPLKKWGWFYKQQLMIESKTPLKREQIKRLMTSRSLLTNRMVYDKFLSIIVINGSVRNKI